jgi:TonB family protein
MPNASDETEATTGTADRRLHARRPIQSLAYVDLGEDNGGLVLNMGQGGMAVRSAVVLAEEHLPKIRFQMPHSMDWVEATGRIAWTGDARRMAGIEFLDLPLEAEAQIREWMNSDIAEMTEDAASAGESENPAQLEETALAPPLAELLPEAKERIAAAISSEPQAELRANTSAKGSAMLAALASKAQPAAGKPAVEGSRTELDKAPAAEETAARMTPPTWAGNSVLNLRAGGALASAALSRKELPRSRSHSWVSLGALAVLLAGLSFYLGISAGQIGMGRVLERARNLITGKSAPANPPQVASSSAAVDGPLSAKASQSGALPTGQTQHNSTTQQSGSQSGPSVTVHRAAPPADGSIKTDDADAADGSTPVLNLPDTPVSATNSVAVSSRLYIPLPEVSGTSRGGNIRIGRLERKSDIPYPQEAAEQRVEGIVKLHIVIGPDGAVRDVTVLNGDSTLAAAASEAIREWRYTPTLLDGQPIETEADVTVTFRLP